MNPEIITVGFDTALSPCPFCGGYPIFDVYSATANTASTYGGASFVRCDFDIKCRLCGTKAPHSGGAYRVELEFAKDGTITIEDGRGVAAAAWNSRGQTNDTGENTETTDGTEITDTEVVDDTDTTDSAEF